MNSIGHFETFQETIGELITLARIGKRFTEIAEEHLTDTCTESKKEATAYPAWYVVAEPSDFETGPFFFRVAAEEYIKKRAKTPCRVKCESGMYSEGYEAILELAATIVGGTPK